MNIRRLTELALLSAVALIIFVIELRIPNPFPIPGVKLGLANIVTVYAVFRCKPSETAMIVAVRLLLGAVFSGNPSALLYSAAGAICCLCGMLLDRPQAQLNDCLLFEQQPADDSSGPWAAIAPYRARLVDSLLFVQQARCRHC